MKRIFGFFKYYKKETVLSPLFKMLEACMELLVPLIIAAIIDNGIKSADTAYIVKMVLLLVAMAVGGLAFALTAQYYAAKCAVGVTARVKSELFLHISSLSYSQLDGIGTPTLITRLTADMNTLQNGINLALRLVMRSPFVVFGAMIMAFTVDFDCALVFAGAIPILAAVIFGVMLTAIPLQKNAQKKLDGVMGRTRQNLTGVRVLRAFNRVESEKQQFIEENDDLTRSLSFVGKITAVLNPATYIIINIAIVILINCGAIKVDSGELTQGAVVALYNYMSQILVELLKLASLIITMARAYASGNRIGEVLSITSDITKPDTPLEPDDNAAVVEFKEVSFAYLRSSEPALKGLDFRLEKGEVLGVIGATGSGKTTLINLIPRFYDPTQGEVLFKGVKTSQLDIAKMRNSIAIVPQKAVLFAGSIRENLRWGDANADDERIIWALKAAQAYDFVKDKEGGLDYYVEQGGKNFSGGQRQRLAIARALVRKPELLILDDSFSALDYKTDSELRRNIFNLEGMSVIIVSQRASSIMNADKIIVLDNGEAVGFGTHEELLDNCEIYREIYKTQYDKGGSDDE